MNINDLTKNMHYIRRCINNNDIDGTVKYFAIISKILMRYMKIYRTVNIKIIISKNISENMMVIGSRIKDYESLILESIGYDNNNDICVKPEIKYKFKGLDENYVIIISRDMFDILTDEEIVACLLHEVGHIQFPMIHINKCIKILNDSKRSNFIIRGLLNPKIATKLILKLMVYFPRTDIYEEYIADSIIKDDNIKKHLVSALRKIDKKDKLFGRTDIMRRITAILNN